jgi:hypothetical protein
MAAKAVSNTPCKSWNIGVGSTDTGWESFQIAFIMYQRLLATGGRVGVAAGVVVLVAAVGGALVPVMEFFQGSCVYSPVIDDIFRGTFIWALYRDA